MASNLPQRHSHHHHHHRSKSPPNERDRLLESGAQGQSTWGAITGVQIAIPDEEEEADIFEVEQGKLTGSRLYITLGAVWGTNLVFSLSATAIATLSPSISSHFNHLSLSSYIGSVFALSSTVATPMFGALTEVVGRTNAMMIACLCYAAGTVWCALSKGMLSLLSARFIAGIGGAGMLTLSSIITTDLVPLRERGLSQGWMMILFGTGSAIGGPLAGWVSDRFSWRVSFWGQLPLLVLAMAAIYILVPATPPAATSSAKVTPAGSIIETSSILSSSSSSTLGDDRQHSLFSSLDVPGLCTMFLSLAALMIGLSLHTTFGWKWEDPKIIALLALSVLSVAVFVVVERSRERQGKRVLIPSDVIGNRTVLWMCVSNFFLTVGNSSLLFNIPLYFAIVEGSTSTSAGLHLLPNAIGISLGSIVAGKIIHMTGRYHYLGLLSLILPIFSSARMAFWLEGTTNPFEYWFDVFPAGLGYSSFLCTSLIALVSSVHKTEGLEVPKATAVSYLFRMLGGVIGLNGSASIQQGVLAAELRSRIHLPTPEETEQTIFDIIHSKSWLKTLPPDLKAEAVSAYGNSLKWTFAFTAAMGLIALLSAVPMEENHLGEKEKKSSDDN